MEKLYLCVEIGGTNLRYGVTDDKYRLLEFDKFPSAGLSDAEDKGEYLENLVNPLIKKYGKEAFHCLTLSLASLMDRERTICYSSPNIKGFDNLPLKAILEERFGLPVFMERDVNTSLLYELWKNGLGKEGITIGVFIGTGLGNAMCIDGKVYIGSTGSSCELGHIPVPGLEEMCGCGKEGCIELKACGKVLARIADEHYGCPVSQIFLKYGDRKDVLDVVKMCALATATEVTILDPVCVILGGGVTEIPGFPMEFFRKTVAENLRIPNPRASLRIISATGDPQAGVVGAAIHAGNQLR